jgi:hypothetical protein
MSEMSPSEVAMSVLRASGDASPGDPAPPRDPSAWTVDDVANHARSMRILGVRLMLAEHEPLSASTDEEASRKLVDAMLAWAKSIQLEAAPNIETIERALRERADLERSARLLKADASHAVYRGAMLAQASILMSRWAAQRRPGIPATSSGRRIAGILGDVESLHVVLDVAARLIAKNAPVGMVLLEAAREAAELEATIRKMHRSLDARA